MRVKLIAKAIVVNGRGEVLLLRRSKTAPRRALQRRTMPKVKLSDEHSGYHVVPREVAPKQAVDYPRVQRVLGDFNKLFTRS